MWDSWLIHGASLVKDKSLSRKSITAHFYRRGMSVQSRDSKKGRSLIKVIKSLLRRLLYKQSFIGEGFYYHQGVMLRLIERVIRTTAIYTMKIRRIRILGKEKWI